MTDEDKVAVVDSDDDTSEIVTGGGDVPEAKTPAFDKPAQPVGDSGAGAGSGSGSLFAALKDKITHKVAPTTTTAGDSDLKDQAVKATETKDDKKQDKKQQKSEAATPSKKSRGSKTDTIAPMLLIRRPDEPLTGLEDGKVGTKWWRADAAQPLEDATAVFVTGRAPKAVPDDLNLRKVILDTAPDGKKAAQRAKGEHGQELVFVKGKLNKDHYGDLIPLVKGKPDFQAIRPSFVHGGTEKTVGRQLRNKLEMPFETPIAWKKLVHVFSDKNIDAKTGQTYLPDEHVLDKCGLKGDKRVRSEITVELGTAKKQGKKSEDEEAADDETDKPAKTNGKGAKRKAASDAEDEPPAKKPKTAGKESPAKKAAENGKEAKKATKEDGSDTETDELTGAAAKALKSAKSELKRFKMALAANAEARDSLIVLRDNAVERRRKDMENKGVPKALAKPVLASMDESSDD